MGNRPFEKNCPNLPKDTLGAIELTQQARKRLKEGFARISQIRPSEGMGCECGFWG
jgi:hypothetical protein